MVTLGYILLGIFALGGLVALHMAFWRRFYWAEVHPDETHLLRCEDGARVALHRYRGQEALAAHPIVVCHGLMTHCLFMDLTPELSLAGYLNRLGFEVWNLELRGTGRYGRPMPWDRRGWRIHLDDFVDRDAPTALAHIEAITGASQVHWVGHSMGGLIGAVVAQGPHAERLASLCCIGAPGRVNAPWFLMALGRLLWLLAWLPFVPTAWIMRFLAPFYTWLPVDVLAIRQENMRAVDIRRLMANGIEDIPWTLASQAMAWAVGGEVVAARDDRNFSRDMALIQTPLLCITGDDDRVVPPATVRFIHEAASSPHRRFIHLGGSEGPGVRYQPYGHADLVLGRRSAVDVFPWVAHHIIEVSGVAVEAPEPGHGFPTEWPAQGGDAMDEDLRAAPMDGYGAQTASLAPEPPGSSPEEPRKVDDGGDLEGSPLGAPGAQEDERLEGSIDALDDESGDDLDDDATPDGADELLDDIEDDAPLVAVARGVASDASGDARGAAGDELKTGVVEADKAASDKAASDKALADDAKADEAKASQAHVGEARRAATKADEVNVDEAASDKAKADEANADEALADEAKADESKADESKADGAKADGAKADEAKVDEAKRGAPVAQELRASPEPSPEVGQERAPAGDEGEVMDLAAVEATSVGGAGAATTVGDGPGAAHGEDDGSDAAHVEEDGDEDTVQAEDKLARVAARLASYGERDEEVGLLSSRSLARRLSRDSAEIRRRPPPGWLPEGTGARRPRPGRLHRAPVGDAVLEALEQSAQRVDDFLGRSPAEPQDDDE